MFDPHRGCHIQNTAAWRDSEIADDQLRKRRHQRSHVISYCAHCSLQTKAKRLEKSGETKQLSLSSIRKLYHISVWKNRSRKTGLPFQMFRFSRPQNCPLQRPGRVPFTLQPDFFRKVLQLVNNPGVLCSFIPLGSLWAKFKWLVEWTRVKIAPSEQRRRKDGNVPYFLNPAFHATYAHSTTLKKN